MVSRSPQLLTLVLDSGAYIVVRRDGIHLEPSPPGGARRDCEDDQANMVDHGATTTGLTSFTCRKFITCVVARVCSILEVYELYNHRSRVSECVFLKSACVYAGYAITYEGAGQSCGRSAHLILAWTLVYAAVSRPCLYSFRRGRVQARSVQTIRRESRIRWSIAAVRIVQRPHTC